jgi:hypothetical protein
MQEQSIPAYVLSMYGVFCTGLSAMVMHGDVTKNGQTDAKKKRRSNRLRHDRPLKVMLKIVTIGGFIEQVSPWSDNVFWLRNTCFEGKNVVFSFLHPLYAPLLSDRYTLPVAPCACCTGEARSAGRCVLRTFILIYVRIVNGQQIYTNRSFFAR